MLTASIGALQQLKAYLRRTPFDTATAEGRSHERYRRALLTSATSVAARVATVISGLVAVPLTVSYLGSERYGLWLTLSSTFTLLAIADFGVSDSILNAVAEAVGRHDRLAAQRRVSSILLVIVAEATLFTTVFIAITPRLD